MFKLLAEGARRGLAVVYSTSEVGECLSVAHRIVVMSRGKISAEFGPGVTKEKIMAASGEVDLEYQLSNAYGLDFCHVVADLQDETPLKALGAAGAAFLGREIGQGTKRLIGVGYGRTLEALVDVLPEQAAPNLQLVSLMGSLTRRSSANPHEVIDHLAQRTGAQAFVMPVPFMANTAADRSVLLEQRAVAEAFALAEECDLMLVGIGATDGGASLVSGGMIEPADMERDPSPGRGRRGAWALLRHRRPRYRDRTFPPYCHAAGRSSAKSGGSSPLRAERRRSTRFARCSPAAF